MKATPTKTFLTDAISESFFLQIENGMFLQLVDEKKSLNAGIYLKRIQVNENNLNEMIEKFELEFKSKMSDMLVKVIGSQELIDKVNPSLKRVSKVKKLIRNNYFELLYVPCENRLRVSVEGIQKNSVVSESDTQNKENIKVLIVDDSKTIQALLKNIFSKSKSLEVVGVADRPSKVESLIKSLKPDLITLDMHMPEMNGVELLKSVINKYHIPTVVISSLSNTEGSLVLDALHNGAIDYIKKPAMENLAEVSEEILEKSVHAANVNLKALSAQNANKSKTKKLRGEVNLDSLIVIGSSTGGTQALQGIITELPNEIPPTLVVQHIPAVFSKALADRLNTLCKFTVKEAEDGDIVSANHIYIAPGGFQMCVKKHGGNLRIVITDDAPVNRFKPSVDYMFDSVNENYSGPLVAAILTGMGKDGAKGLLRLKNKGAHTIAQDKDSCVVFGMPKEAIRLGAATEVVSLNDIPDKMLDMVQQSSRNHKNSA